MFCISLKNLFTILCSSLTLALVSQVIFTYVVEKPTTTAKVEKRLEVDDLPEVVVCLDHGLNNESLLINGYQNSYWRGAMKPGGNFVGWNGEDDEIKSSHDILEDALIVPNKTQLIRYAGYSKGSKVAPRMLVYPFGRCISIDPPPKETGITPNILRIRFNISAFKTMNVTFNRLRLFFMDKANSPRLYPDEMEMTGSQIELQGEFDNTFYRTKISRFHHVQGDPLFDCSAYTLENSYNDCIQNEIRELFDGVLGCQPPLFTEDSSNMCNHRFNFSRSKSQEVFKLFYGLIFHDWKSKCKVPCTKNKYTTKFQINFPNPALPLAELNIIFDKTLDVTRSTFSMNEQALLTNLGGSVSSGRTVLWILVTLLGAVQVISYQFLIFSR